MDIGVLRERERESVCVLANASNRVRVVAKASNRMHVRVFGVWSCGGLSG